MKRGQIHHRQNREVAARRVLRSGESGRGPCKA
nr:MAG TPA: hypothetical protein [Caudoviricetes sp.]